MSYFFTSESVCPAHPDKVCDRIADAILDRLLAQDSRTRAAVEVTACSDFVHIMGEVTTKANLDYKKVAKETIYRLGYTSDELGFSHNTNIITNIHEQSPDIAMGVDAEGAGDQGIMFGYATSETKNYMPLTINLARQLTTALCEARESGFIPYIRPDGKAQVTLEYNVRHKPLRAEAVVLSAQHDPDIDIEDLRARLLQDIIHPTLEHYIDENTKIYINPTGRFVIGGPAADTGLTGRKIIVDTYGGWAPHGGGAFSGKDPTKVDRSASYAARNIAKTLVASGVARRCLVQLSYAIGVKQPLSIFLNTYNTSLLSEDNLIDWIRANYDLSPQGIIRTFGLRNPMYEQLNVIGHFGGDQNWEECDENHLKELKQLVWSLS